MPLVLSCSNCGQKISIPEELKGKQVRCPKCSKCFAVERRKNKLPESSAVATTPAAQSQAGRRTATPNEPPVIQCPSCRQKLRLPAAAGTSTFQCPRCAETLNIGKRRGGGAVAATSPRPPGSRPSASRPSGPRSVGSTGSDATGVAEGFAAGSAPSSGDSLFSDLPPMPGANQIASHGPAPASAAPSGFSTPSRGASFGGGGGVGRRTNASMLGPGLLIAIPYFLALLLFLFALVPLLLHDELRSSNLAITVLVVLFGLSASHFVAAIAGAVGMIMSTPRWMSITTCIGAMLPTIFVTNFCFGFLLYPVVLGGCIWGLISLVGNSGSRAGYACAGYGGAGAGPPSPYQSGGAAAAGNDYLRQAQSAAAGKSSSDVGVQSIGKALLCIIGGLGCLGVALFAGYLYYQYMNDEAEVRRPGRAISGAVIATITGIGLIIQGIAFFAKRSG